MFKSSGWLVKSKYYNLSQMGKIWSWELMFPNWHCPNIKITADGSLIQPDKG